MVKRGEKNIEKKRKQNKRNQSLGNIKITKENKEYKFKERTSVTRGSQRSQELKEQTLATLEHRLNFWHEGD